MPDSPSVHSNESNSQVGGEDRSTSTILGPFGGGAGLRRGVISPKDPHFPQLTQHLLSTNSEDDGDRDSEYVGDSELNDNDLDDPGNREPLQPRFEQLLPLDDDGDSSDTYLPSCLNYHLHPNQYLPNYDNITAANTDTEGDDNGSLTGGVGINNLVLRRCPPLSSSMTTAGGRATVGGNNNSNYGYLGHHQRMSRIHDPRRSLELPAGDDMSVSVGGYTSTNASCSDISGNLCEIEDSEVFSDVDMDVEDLEVKKVVQNTASTAL